MKREVCECGRPCGTEEESYDSMDDDTLCFDAVLFDGDIDAEHWRRVRATDSEALHRAAMVRLVVAQQWGVAIALVVENATRIAYGKCYVDAVSIDRFLSPDAPFHGFSVVAQGCAVDVVNDLMGVG